MKTCIKSLFPLAVLINGFALFLAGRVTAQTFTNLHSFTGSEGSSPIADLVLSGNTLYGTAQFGGSTDNGVVFKVNTDGTGFTNLHNFTTVYPIEYTNSDGAFPHAGLILSGDILYGTTYFGGSFGMGCVFAINTNGTGFTNLHNFAGYPNEGANPQADLVLSGNTLYGTTYDGGASGHGTVFAVNTDGAGFTNLYSFTALSNSPPYGNTDGAYPSAGLILSGNNLYGTAYAGGPAFHGTVFRINIDGTGFTNLYSFTEFGDFNNTNSDGAYPQGSLILSGSILYGTAVNGGRSGNGTLFALKTDGTTFTNLHSFTALGQDGAYPQANLILSGNVLYGTAASGGSSGNGTVFSINKDGTGFVSLYEFTQTPGPFAFNSDGAFPQSGLILSGNVLYGTTVYGGSAGKGTVFRITIQPKLTIILSASNVVLTWPTNAAGFTLQSTTNLVSPTVWSINSPAPVVVSGQNTVTNPISGGQKFYRLIQ